MKIVKPCAALAIATLAIALIGCSSSSSGSDSAASDTDTAITGDDAFITSAIERSTLSGLALPALPADTTEVAKPTGSACDLAILDWAGFDGAASYSFDDGQPSHVQNWPSLKATGVPMTFYLVPSMGAGASDDAVWKEALAAGCELGNHTYGHKKLADYAGSDALAKDIADCDSYLEGTLGETAARSFAYPYGETGWKDSFGGKFLFARTVNSGTVKPNDSTDPLALPVFFVSAGQTKKDFNAALDASAGAGSWVIFLFHTILPGASWYAPVETTDVTASVGHAKNGGKLWLDTVETVGAYWLAQRNLTPTFSGETGTDAAKRWTWTLPAGYPTGKYLRVTVSGGTLSQGGKELPWNPRGFYEVALDGLSLDWAR